MMPGHQKSNGCDFYTPKQIASKLGITVQALYLQMKIPAVRKNLPPFKRPSRRVILFPIHAYERWALIRQD